MNTLYWPFSSFSLWKLWENDEEHGIFRENRSRVELEFPVVFFLNPSIEQLQSWQTIRR